MTRGSSEQKSYAPETVGTYTNLPWSIRLWGSSWRKTPSTRGTQANTVDFCDIVNITDDEWKERDMDLVVKNVRWFIHSNSKIFQWYSTQAAQSGAICFGQEGCVVFLLSYLINFFLVELTRTCPFWIGPMGSGAPDCMKTPRNKSSDLPPNASIWNEADMAPADWPQLYWEYL